MPRDWRAIVLRYDELPSTNDEALNQARRGAAEGVCVVAEAQTAGRGRQQRSWSSPAGAGLYLSIVLRPALAPHDWPLISFAAALAVHDALLEACALAADLKWPNDVHLDGKKLCGILAETCETPQGRACVVGLGVNLRERAWPLNLRDAATSIEAHTGRAPDAEKFLTALLRAFGARYAALHADAARTLRDWEARSSYAQGRLVRVHAGDEAFDGTTRGLQTDGALRVELIDGEIKIVRAGDVVSLRSETPG